jgi:NitT/TauT family transport system substrate-binding protein
VDAVITWQPHFNTIKGLIPDKVVAWQAQNDRLINNLVITNQSWALDHPDVVVRFLKALDQAEIFMIHDPERSKDIVQGRLNYSENYTEQIWPENQFSLTLDQSLIFAMEDQARWMIRNNLTQSDVPNFLHYIYFKGLETVDPGSVNIIR